MACRVLLPLAETSTRGWRGPGKPGANHSGVSRPPRLAGSQPRRLASYRINKNKVQNKVFYFVWRARPLPLPTTEGTKVVRWLLGFCSLCWQCVKKLEFYSFARSSSAGSDLRGALPAVPSQFVPVRASSPQCAKTYTHFQTKQVSFKEKMKTNVVFACRVESSS